MVSYQPNLPQAGRYAVYVSYQTVDKSVDDAEYIVYHKGQETAFRVNQQMGGGTWVYLGTFDFDAGSNQFNRVVVTNRSKKKRRFVTTDAVRFGGGMGNIQRGGSISGLPRTLEGSRYYAQWAGAPYSVYGGKGGQDDYSDDINARSKMTNWLAGGSVFAPSLPGLRVPLELALAVHSDAGYSAKCRQRPKYQPKSLAQEIPLGQKLFGNACAGNPLCNTGNHVSPKLSRHDTRSRSQL